MRNQLYGIELPEFITNSRFNIGDRIRIIESHYDDRYGHVKGVTTTTFGREYLDILTDDGEKINKFAGHCEIYR